MRQKITIGQNILRKEQVSKFSFCSILPTDTWCGKAWVRWLARSRTRFYQPHIWNHRQLWIDCIPLNSLDIFLVSDDILWIPYQSQIFLVLTAYALKIKIFDHQKNLLDGSPEALWDSINHTFRITVNYGLIVSLWIPWIFFLYLTIFCEFLINHRFFLFLQLML